MIRNHLVRNVLFSLLLLSVWGDSLAPMGAVSSINFQSSQPTASNPSVFKYATGGNYWSPRNYWRIGGSGGETGNMQLDLTLAQATPMRLLIDVVSVIVSGQNGFNLSVEVNGTPLVADFGDTNVGFHNLAWNIPESLLVAGTNTINLLSNPNQEFPTYLWIRSASVQPATITLDLETPAPPDTYSVSQPDFDYLAWNMFIAMNWPALVPSATNGYLRGFPNTNSSFASASPGDLVVWETFKEKREVFYPLTVPSPSPAAWNADYNYGPGLSTGNRAFLQSTKVHTLDETVEVASEALESGLPSDRLGQIVGARVWLGKPQSGTPTATDPLNAVRYEVKVNYDFYDYVVNYPPKKNSPLYIQANAENASFGGNIELPYRETTTSTPSPTDPTKYSSSAAVTQYQQVNANAGSKPNTLPYTIGSVHVKAAWIPLTSQEISSGRYHMANDVEYFIGHEGSQTSGSATFGLVGLHIIQRLHLTNSDAPAGVGGTFIFATWEHVDNDQIDANGDTKFYYSNYYPTRQVNGKPAPDFYPDPFGADVYPVKRKYGILRGTQAVNNQVHTALQQAVGPGGSSVWTNYELIGTQFMPVNIQPGNKSNDPTGIGQPLYLSNLVIETNEGLQQFQGQPPATNVINHYGTQFAKIPSNSDPSDPSSPKNTTFNRNTPNLAFRQKSLGVNGGFNMGGCLGCHGVAQLRGYSFSFVLLGNQAGAETDSESDFGVPPLNEGELPPGSGE